MSFVSALLQSMPRRTHATAETEDGLARHLFKAGEVLRSLRVQLRHGQLSRAPLRLLRLQVVDDVVECDWLARRPDPWDASLSRSVQQRNASLQALRDAIDVRAMLFDVLPQVDRARMRVYRISDDCTRQLIINGLSNRGDRISRKVHSLAMRAKILGFSFNLESDILHELTGEEHLQADS
jgi:hypothetical protein